MGFCSLASWAESQANSIVSALWFTFDPCLPCPFLLSPSLFLYLSALLFFFDYFLPCALEATNKLNGIPAYKNCRRPCVCTGSSTHAALFLSFPLSHTLAALVYSLAPSLSIALRLFLPFALLHICSLASQLRTPERLPAAPLDNAKDFKVLYRALLPRANLRAFTRPGCQGARGAAGAAAWPAEPGGGQGAPRRGTPASMQRMRLF